MYIGYLVTERVNYSDETQLNYMNSPLFMYNNGVMLTDNLFVTQTKFSLASVITLAIAFVQDRQLVQLLVF